MDDEISARLTNIEEKVSHLEKTVSDLDGVMTDVSQRLDALLGQMKRLTTIERVMAEKEAPADDKPPHY